MKIDQLRSSGATPSLKRASMSPWRCCKAPGLRRHAAYRSAVPYWPPVPGREDQVEEVPPQGSLVRACPGRCPVP
eukprot:7147319-Pyramimonas_sp.AAC.1